MDYFRKSVVLIFYWSFIILFSLASEKKCKL